MQTPVRVGVVFGSRSVEHEVSIITACQLMKAVPPEYLVVPLYIDKRGHWWTGEALRDIKLYGQLDLENPAHEGLESVTLPPDPTAQQVVDVVVNCVHGSYGEDGTLAGLFALADIPFAAPAVVPAAVAIDKIITKHVATSAGIAVTPYFWFTREQWMAEPTHWREMIGTLQWPVFVKPAHLGSSVGVTRVTTPKKLEDALELAFAYADRVIVEEAAHDCIEVNIAVTGSGAQARASVSEQPVATDEFLSYADKYERGGKKTGGMAGLSRRIPAPITPNLQEKLQAAALKLWSVIDGSGVARVDFFANPSTEQFFVGEINAPPGSMAFYLWEATDLRYSDLVRALVQDALERHAQLKRRQTTIASNILAKK